MAHQVGSALGSYIPGALHDVTGSYTPSLLGRTVALRAAMTTCLFLLPGKETTSQNETTDASRPQSLTADAA